MSRRAFEYFDFDKNDVSGGQFVHRVGFENPEEPPSHESEPPTSRPATPNAGTDHNSLLGDGEDGPLKSKVHRFLQGSFFLLGLVGLIVSLVSFAIDFVVYWCLRLRSYLVTNLTAGPLYPAWLSYTLWFALLSVAVTRFVSPHAAGSGIPQMKAVLRGISLKEYLSMRTLVAKVVGITLSLSSGLPIGKEGPFVHISSIVAQQLMKRVSVFRTFKDNEGRRLDILSAACAVGVASSFGAPIGGVLFSIEVTSSFFSVRNYWRGFFATVVGAFIYALLGQAVTNESVYTAAFSTDSETSMPYRIGELLVFAALGLICGLVGALFVMLNRLIVTTMRAICKPGKPLAFLNTHWVIYPAIATIIISSVLFPGIAPYVAVQKNIQITQLFSRRPLDCFLEWNTGNIVGALILSASLRFFMTALAISIPFPAGVFMPVFVIGALLGRFTGEIMALWFPSDNLSGVGRCSVEPNSIVPGSYAIVGAAALTAAVTHSISTSVIIFELTGSITRILPVMIAVLLANAVAQKLSPSIYDSIIQLNGIPYVPSLRQLSRYGLIASKIMRRDVAVLMAHATYRDAIELLRDSQLQRFPVIDGRESRILVGAVTRLNLRAMIAIKFMDRTVPVQAVAESAPGDQRRGVRRVRSAMRNIISTIGDVAWNDKDANDFDADFYLNAPGPDASAEERQCYAELDMPLDFTALAMDQSPFQLADSTSLHHLHTIFTLLGVQLVYITRAGRLVGAVGIDELRKAVEPTSNSPDDTTPAHPTHAAATALTHVATDAGPARNPAARRAEDDEHDEPIDQPVVVDGAHDDDDDDEVENPNERR